jgi:hypothetical protein
LEQTGDAALQSAVADAAVRPVLRGRHLSHLPPPAPSARYDAVAAAQPHYETSATAGDARQGWHLDSWRRRRPSSVASSEFSLEK